MNGTEAASNYRKARPARITKIQNITLRIQYDIHIVSIRTYCVHNTVSEYQCKQSTTVIGTGLPQQAEVAQGVPGRLRPRIFLTFDTRVVGTRVVGRQPYAPAAFTPGEIRGTHF